MFRFIYFFLFLPLTIVSANAITLNCQFNEKINPAYANEIMCGMDSKVWGGKQFDLCDFKTSLAGAYISGLVLKNNKGQILNKWSQSFINYAIKKDGSFRLNMDYFEYPTGFKMINKRFENLFGPKGWAKWKI